MTALIVLFLAGYVGYAAILWDSHSRPLDLIVPGVFFLGACFVWLSANLSLQTATDVMRVSLLERESMTDPLTGVFNRRYLDRRLGEEVAKARRYGLPLCALATARRTMKNWCAPPTRTCISRSRGSAIGSSPIPEFRGQTPYP